jgi:hypothetical protein
MRKRFRSDALEPVIGGAWRLVKPGCIGAVIKHNGGHLCDQNGQQIAHERN